MKRKASCSSFDLEYPVDYAMPDGTTISMSDEEDWDAIKARYEDHLDSIQKPSLNYSVDVIFEDGSILNVANEEEIEEAKKECE